VNGVPALITQLEGVPMETMREMSDWFRGKAKSGVFVAGSNIDGKPQLIVVVTDDLTKRGLHAGNIIREVAGIVGGGGGGRPTMAQAGGKNSDKLPEALELARLLVSRALEG
jgi:alanyl-tRNA synthetase